MNDFNPFAAEFAAEPWAMEPARLEALMCRLAQPLVTTSSANVASVGRRSQMRVDGDEAVIPISGVLVNKIPRSFAFWGIEATSYQDIASDIAAAAADDSVKSIRLVVSSPGGQVAGVKEAADSIAAVAGGGKKKVVAEIQEIGASAAYWLASQANEVVSAPNAIVGSIGVYSAYADFSRLAENAGIKVHLIASGPLKGMGVPGTRITDEQIAAMQEVVNGMAQAFKADVARGRGMQPAEVDAVSTGRVWTAEQAVGNGLVDGIATQKQNDMSGAPGVRAAVTYEAQESKEETMDPKALEAAADQARKDAQAAEQKRVQDITAAFGGKDAAFALRAVTENWTVEQAKAAYADVLEAKLAEANDKARVASEKAAKACAGADPVAMGPEPKATVSDPAEHPFMVLVSQRMKENGGSRTEAMSYCCGKNRKLYAEWERMADAKALARKEAIA